MNFLTEDKFGLADDFITGSPRATPFHTTAWLRLTRDAFGFRPLYLLRGREPGPPECVLPLFEVDTLWGKKIVSLPLRDKGGAIYTGTGALEAAIDDIIDFSSTKKYAYIHIKTNNPEEASLLERKSFVNKGQWPTSIIRLEKDFASTRKNFTDKRINWSINKAVRNRLVFEGGTTLAHVGDFFRIFFFKRKRLGVPAYPRKFFEKIHELFMTRGAVKLFFVRRHDVRLTAIMIFLLNKKAYDVYSASLDEAFEFRANDFQMFSVIQWLCDNGFGEYDLGADSPYQKTLIDYKRKWGSETKDLYFFYYFIRSKDITIQDSDHPRYRLLRSIWKNMPDTVFEKIGSKLIKYMA